MAGGENNQHIDCSRGKEIALIQQQQEFSEREAERRHQEGRESTQAITHALNDMTDRFGEYLAVTSRNTVEIKSVKERTKKLEDHREVDNIEIFTRLRAVEGTPGRMATKILGTILVLIFTVYLGRVSVTMAQNKEPSHKTIIELVKKEIASAAVNN